MLKRELGVDAELARGSRGEFSVWVGDRMVAKKGFWSFPGEAEVLEAVRSALTPTDSPSG